MSFAVTRMRLLWVCTALGAVSPSVLGRPSHGFAEHPNPAKVRQRSLAPLPDVLRCPPLGSATERELSGIILSTPLGVRWGFPAGTSEEPACQCSRCKRHEFDPWVWKIPWRRARQPTPVFLPGESHGQRSLAGYTFHGVTKSRTQRK